MAYAESNGHVTDDVTQIGQNRDLVIFRCGVDLVTIWHLQEIKKTANINVKKLKFITWLMALSCCYALKTAKMIG